MWGSSVYSSTNTFLLRGGAIAGGKCFDFGANIPVFLQRELGSFSQTSSQAASSDDGLVFEFSACKDKKHKVVGWERMDRG